MIDAKLVALFKPIARLTNETVVAVFLDRAGALLAMRHCPSESFARIDVPIRIIAGDALAFDARQVVLAHNHPSGDPEPSGDDLAATRRIALALDALGIRLVDHLVLAGDGITSFRARGLL